MDAAERVDLWPEETPQYVYRILHVSFGRYYFIIKICMFRLSHLLYLWAYVA